MVSKDKQIWHCFGCGEGGDVFSFVQKMEGLEFIEALRLLGQKAGVKVETQSPEIASQKNRILDIVQLTAKFWHKTLLDFPQAKKARDYLKQRQISDRTIMDFNLGYAVDSWDSLINFLKTRKYTDQEIFLAGLSVKKDRGQGFYDRFRDRLIFPINDFHGNPIGFSARILKADEQSGKYINTPQTLIYNKSLVIFNLDKAKAAIKKHGYVVVVEGQMDVLSAYQAGTENVIATSGTALTLDQLKILKRYTDNLMIAFDTDAAGESAAKRGIDLALTEELNVKIIELPEGKDPDECIRKDRQIWFKAVENAKSIMDYYFDQTLARVDLAQVEGKKKAAKILLPVINKIGNKIEQTHWLQKLAEQLNVSEQVLRESLPRQIGQKSASPISQPEQPSRDRNLMLFEQILAISLKYPINITYLVDHLSPEFITDSDLQNIYKNLVIYYTETINGNASNFDYQDFYSTIKSDNLNVLADRLVLLAEKDFFDFDQDAIRDELIKTINFCKKNFYTSRLKKIEGRIKQAEDQNNKSEVKKLVDQFNEVVSQLNILD